MSTPDLNPGPTAAEGREPLGTIPVWLDPSEGAALAARADHAAVERAIRNPNPGLADLAALLSPAADALMEPMARKAQALTARHFGRTISLYVPLYLSDYCSSGCVYCGFASDRQRPRRVLGEPEIRDELARIKHMGFEEVLLLTGERTREAEFDYLRRAVELAAGVFHVVTVEAFPMTGEEYRALAAAGCTGVTLYQETYDPTVYRAMHRWGPKRDYSARLDGPSRLLGAGIRSSGIGALFGLADPVRDAISLYRHAVYLRRRFWRSGISISFPRICAQLGGFAPPHPVDERLLARVIFAFRICLPDVPLALSTRERAAFRDGMAGVGISKMSIASRTSVGGYGDPTRERDGQFHVNDERDVDAFCAMLRRKQLEPVFKNGEAVFR